MGAAAETLGAAAYAAVKASGATRLALRLDLDPALATHVALGVRLAAYRFDRYRTTEKADAKPSIEEVVVEVDDPAAAQAAFAPLSAVGDAMTFARDLVSEPANVLFPEEYARRIEGLRDLGLEVEVMDEAALDGQGLRPPAGGGAGERVREPRGGHALERRGRSRRPAHRLRGQGRDLRRRRHQPQARRRHGGHEVGHGRFGGRGRRHARAGRPQGPG